jgi:integrase
MTTSSTPVDPRISFRHFWATPEPVPPSNAELRVGFSRDQEDRGLKSDTLRKRELHLVAFDRWLGASYFTATADQLAAFLDGRQLGDKARYLWISNLHRFYRWAIDGGLTTVDPTAKMERPKTARPVPRPARSDELAGALERAARAERCWILLAAYEGLKVSEIARLRWEDVLKAEGNLRVRVIGRSGARSERFIRLHPDVLRELLALGEEPSGWVFTRPLGGPYPPERLSRALNVALRRLGVHATAEQLRHWFAAEHLAATGDLRATQEALGHAWPATTANLVTPE